MPKISLVLHNIRSTHNVGSIFRTAEGLGVKNIILTGYTPYPSLGKKDPRLPHLVQKITSQIHKTALGAEDIIQFEQFDNFEDWYQSNNLRLVGLEQSQDSIPLSTYRPPDEFALILGEEVNGINPDILARCQDIIEIPMTGQKESFNVSVACGIALYALTT